MSTVRATVWLVSGGLAIALVVAAVLRLQWPQGVLLYTPAPGVPANYTPSSALGFFLIMLGLLCLSLMATALASVLAWLKSKSWISVAKVTALSSIGFGVLLLFVTFTEQRWP